MLLGIRYRHAWSTRTPYALLSRNTKFGGGKWRLTFFAPDGTPRGHRESDWHIALVGLARRYGYHQTASVHSNKEA